VGSGGTLPDSVAVFGDLVYVANSGASSNYTVFRLRPKGRLDPIPGSTITLAAHAAPGDVLFNGTGTKLVGTEVGLSVIDSFTVGSDGRLTAAPGSPFPAQGLGPFGSEFRPTEQDQLFVSNAHNTAPDSGTVSAFRDHRNGRLSPVNGSPFADGQMAPCWVEISRHRRQLVLSARAAISRTNSGHRARGRSWPMPENPTIICVARPMISTTGGAAGSPNVS
jgi:6-phosphogluconolactonase